MNMVSLLFSYVLLVVFFVSILSLDVWTVQKYPNCTEFNGCLTFSDRQIYLNPSAPCVPCGFLVPSDLDKVRNYFSRDHKCEMIVYSLVFQAYNVVFNPVSFKNYLKEYSNICFFLFVDRVTLLNGYSLEYISNGNVNKQNTKFHLESEILGGQAWQVILLENLPYQSPARSMKTIKFSALSLFPNAKMFLWYDPKYVLKRWLPNLVADAISLMNKNRTDDSIASVALAEHFIHDLESGFGGAKERLVYLNYTYKKNQYIDKELQEIDFQQAIYKKEGLFNRTRGNFDLAIDSAIMIYMNSEETRRYFCAWANEISMFSRRDQLSEFVVRE